jgi:hypothetical protein
MLASPFPSSPSQPSSSARATRTLAAHKALKPSAKSVSVARVPAQGKKEDKKNVDEDEDVDIHLEEKIEPVPKPPTISERVCVPLS